MEFLLILVLYVMISYGKYIIVGAGALALILLFLWAANKWARVKPF